MAARSSYYSGWRVAGISCVVAGFFALVLVGCSSTPQERYRVLSFFFDGVPDPDAAKKVAAKQASSGRITYIHKPYQDNQCNSCHLNTSDIFARAQVPQNVCLNCHSNVATQHAVMHGPVVNNECMMCHSPHSSAVPHLLKQPAPAVCTQCHEPDVLKVMHRPPFDPTTSCVSCHSGHGGTDHRLLVAFTGGTLLRPTTLPVRGVPR